MAEQFKGYTASELTEMVAWELGQVSGTTVTYTKFTEAKIREKLTQRQNDFVAATHCIKKFAIIQAKSGYRRYPLPTICIDDGVTSVKFFDASTSYTELDIVDKGYIDDIHEGHLTDGDSTPEYCWHGESYGNRQMIEVYPGPDTDGTNYLATANIDTGVYYGDDLPGIQNDVAGTTDAAGTATSLKDSTVNFTTIGMVTGMFIRNVTDASYAYATVLANGVITTSTLAGGTANTWASGDTYQILAGEYGVHIDLDNNAEKYLYGYIPGVLSNLTIPADNFLVEFVPFPALLPSEDNDDQYPEIPKQYHTALFHGTCADLLGSFHEKAQEFQRSAYHEAQFQAALAKAAGKKGDRPFRKKASNMRPVIRANRFRR